MKTLTEEELDSLSGGEGTIADTLVWIWEVQLAWRRYYQDQINS